MTDDLPSLLPRDVRRPVYVNAIVPRIVSLVTGTGASASITEAVTQVLTQYRVRGERSPAVSTNVAMSARITNLVSVSSGPRDVAISQASLTVLRESFPGGITIVGWVLGEVVERGSDSFMLLGEPCPVCVINPIVFGESLYACLDTRDCGWVYDGK